MSIPILRARNLNDGDGFRFQLIDHLTGQPLFNGQWFSETETKRRAIDYAQASVQMNIARAKADYVDGHRPLRRR
jgi:hypothetical protein